jgi:cytochrome c oxidase subunit II
MRFGLKKHPLLKLYGCFSADRTRTCTDRHDRRHFGTVAGAQSHCRITGLFVLQPIFLFQERINQSSLSPAGPMAARISTLWWIHFAILIAVFFAVVAVLAAALLRHREVRIHPNLSPEHITERRLMKVVVTSVIVTTIILFSVLFMDVVTGRAISPLDKEVAVTIKVTAAQWWWKIEYEDRVASQNVTTANEIHIPVGKPVLLRLMSNDVIHSFWVPSLQGKRDLIPGKDRTTLLIQADEVGTYDGQCAEFCGHQHANMRFVVIAETPDQFESWRDAQRQPAAEPMNDVAIHGRDVFLKSSCVLCHEIRGTDAGGKVAPELTHLASRRRLAAGTLPNTPQHLTTWIRNPQGVKPGVKMPTTRLTPADLQAIVGYLEGLK